MFWQASAVCASCGTSMLVRPLPGLTETRLACTAGWGGKPSLRPVVMPCTTGTLRVARKTKQNKTAGWGLGRGTGGLGKRAWAALALPQRAYIGDG